MKAKTIIAIGSIIIMIIAITIISCVRPFYEEAAQNMPLPEIIRLTDFSPNELQRRLGKEPFVLFFSAKWCYSCQKLEKEIIEKAPYLANTMLKVDYSNQKLRKEYSVTLPTTIIVFNSDGVETSRHVNPTLELLINLLSK